MELHVSSFVQLRKTVGDEVAITLPLPVSSEDGVRISRHFLGKLTSHAK